MLSIKEVRFRNADVQIVELNEITELRWNGAIELIRVEVPESGQSWVMGNKELKRTAIVPSSNSRKRKE